MVNGRETLPRLAVGFGLAIGCGGGGGAGSGPVMGDGTPTMSAPATPTWHQDVAPLVTRSCVGCHRSGGIAPFSLESYEEARPFAHVMRAASDASTMPPWGAFETGECKPRLPWKHDLRLGADEKDLLKRWSEAGAPEGDPSRKAALGDVLSLELSNTNARATMARPFVASGTRDIFRCFPLPFVFPEDVWLTGVQVAPGNGRVVHHVLVWLDSDNRGQALAGAEGSYECSGQPHFQAPLLGAWAPGSVPIELPPDVSLPVKKGSRIVLNIHYHPLGDSREMDTTSLDLRWSTAKTTWEGAVALVGNFTTRDANGNGLLPGPDDPPGGVAFRIPAGAKDHVESLQFVIPPALIFGAKLWAVGTHMHYVGTDMRIEIDRSKRFGGPSPGEPVTECLLETPRWNFNWQRGYVYDAPLDQLPTVRTGDVVRMRCLYDNTMDNPHVRDALSQQGLGAPKDVVLGESTLDEMCLGVFALAFQRP